MSHALSVGAVSVIRANAKSDHARFFLPQLDGLRFFAFLGVFVFHSLPTTAGPWRGLVGEASEALARLVTAGHMGVELFFVLSSFLITELLLRESERSGTIDVPSFWMRRILRIWPLYFALLALASALSWVELPGHRLTPEAFAFFGLFAGNWYVYLYGFPSTFASVLWTVSIEEQFYLAWPLVMRRARKHALILLSVGLVLVAVIARASLLAAGDTHRQLATNTLCRLDAIGAGALLASVLHGRLERPLIAPLAGWLWIGLGVVALVVASSAWSPALPFGALGATLVLSGVLLSRAGHSVLSAAPLVYLGKISYGLYALHTLVLVSLVALPFPDSALGKLARLASALALTVVLASISYRWIERPFLRFKDRFGALSRPA